MNLNAQITKPPKLKQHQFKRRQLMPLTDLLLWQIDAGIVRSMTSDEEGNIVTIGFWGAGDVVGRPLFCVYPYQIECLSMVEASILPRNYSYPHDILISQLQKTQELLRIIHSQKIRYRLLKLLNWLGERFGNQIPEGQLVDIRLTHQELAEIISTSRVTVTRLLNKFEEERKIAWSNSNGLIIFNQ